MLNRYGFVLAILIASAGSAAAQDNMCSDPPVAPAIPTAADINKDTPQAAAEAKHQAFLDIKNWQGSLKSYRDCLDASITTNTRLVAEAQQNSKPDKDKIAKLQQQIDAANHAHDISVDDEERTVNEFNAVRTAYCLRNDVDRASCPKT
jgi:hypothetical protein